MVKAAEETKATGATEFCLVLAIRGPDEKIMRWLEEVTPVIIEQTGMQVAVSAGVLDKEQAARLRGGGVHRYNHNLETAQVVLRAHRHHRTRGKSASRRAR